MILLEVPHVSLRLQLRAKAVDDVAHAAAQILWRHAFGDACFVAHSYGTFCVSRICQLHRSLVHSMVRSCFIRSLKETARLQTSSARVSSSICIAY